MPVYAIPSPNILSDLLIGKGKTINVVCKFITSIAQLKYDIRLILPCSLYNELETSQIDYCKVFVSHIRNHTNNFQPMPDNSPCPDQTPIIRINGNPCDTNYSSVFIRIFKSWDGFLSFPIILSNSATVVEKGICDSHSCNASICKGEFSKEFPKLNADTIKQLLEKAKQYNFDKRLYRFSSKKTYDARKIVMHFLDLLGVEKDKRKRYEITDFIVSDVNERIEEYLFPLLLSAARAIGFPPASADQGLPPEAIDYHDDGFDDEKKHYETMGKRFLLKRLDVFDSLKQNGIALGSSGPLRIQIAEYDFVQYYIGFTDEHDFDRAVIESRINSLASSI